MLNLRHLLAFKHRVHNPIQRSLSQGQTFLPIVYTPVSDKVYKDFLTVCKYGDLQAMQTFHDIYIWDRLRSPKPPANYWNSMSKVYRECKEHAVRDPVLNWFAKENHQLY